MDANKNLSLCEKGTALSGAVLRIMQVPGSADDKYRFDISAEVPGLNLLGTSAEIQFVLTPQEREDIRWYLEDYLEFDEQPAPMIAHRVEQQLAEWGEQLFFALFQASPQTSDLWACLRPHLADTRVEITTDIVAATTIPWEMIRDSQKGPLAIHAQSFVHTQGETHKAFAPMYPEPDKVRILLVICRPGGGEDVPFRSVANRLIKGLDENARGMFDLDVLRPLSLFTV